MKNLAQHTGKFEVIERLNNSINGNPRYLCRFDGFTVRTAPDSSLAYTVPNLNGKTCRGHIGTYYGKATLHHDLHAEGE